MKAKQYARKFVGIGYITLSVMALLTSLIAKPFVDIYNLSTESSGLALKLILLYNLMTAVFWTVSFVLPHIFRAASDVRYTAAVAMLSMWICRVALSYAFALWFDLGLIGVWLAMFVDWVVRAIFFVIHFSRGKWLMKYNFKLGG